MTKYGAVPTEIDGIRFASKAEAKRYADLRLLERAGEIENLELQPRFPLHVNGKLVCTYVADFQYWDKAKSKSIVEDVKGVETPVFKLKRKLFQAVLHRNITVVTS